MTSDQYFIIRTVNAGVFCAQIESRNGSEATLLNARRIHYWQDATECIGLATSATPLGSQTRITSSISKMEVLGVIEVLPMTPEAYARINQVKKWTI